MAATLDLDALAAEMARAQAGVRQIIPFTDRHPDFDVPAAYQVAHRIHQVRLRDGAVPAGRKIGFTNPEMWAIHGVREPVWGHVYDRTLTLLDGPRGRCGLGGFTEPRIEPEIVFRFRSAPRPGEDLLDALDWVAHGFEIVQSHFPGWIFKAADTIADNGLHGALLVGEPQPLASLGPDPAGALAAFTLALARNGQLQAEGRGSNVLGNPLAALEHLLAVLAGQPESEPIRAGEIVTTGTITPALPVRPGETWTTELRGVELPGIQVAFA